MEQTVTKNRGVLRLLLGFLLAAAVLFGLWQTTDRAFAASKLKLSRTETTLYVGDSETLCLLNSSAQQRKSVKWKTSDSAVCTVTKKGKITAENAGEAVITAKLRGKKYHCVVTVKDPAVIFAEVPEEGNQDYQDDVIKEMTSPAFWYSKYKNSGEVLMDAAAIAAQNQKNYDTTGTNMYDLKNMDLAYNSVKTTESLVEELMGYVKNRVSSHPDAIRNGVPLDEESIEAWFAEMKENIEGYEAKEEDARRYGICVKRADLWMAPSSDLVGWDTTDADDELLNSSVNVNEPVLLGQTTADGAFVQVYTSNCSGWVETDHFAVCDSKEDWLTQWDFTGREDQVLVVTDSHITLEESHLAPNTSKLDLYFGTQLPLVPKDRIESIAERYPWYNYTVYIPVRGDDGKLTREMAMIASHHKVSVGFPKMTIKNILTIAYNCLGDRYGWGGMLGAMDCSMYTRNIYRCFGLEIPRNTNWQPQMPVKKTDLTGLTDDEKKEILKDLAPGSLLKFSGHITMYLGEDNGKFYVISDLGSLAESTEDAAVKSIYTLSINSLDVKRRNGNTWLSEMTDAVTPFESADIEAE